MKKLLLIFFILSSFNSKGAIYQISVWNGYYQFLPPNNITIQLGDTIQWIPLDPPTMYHTITSDNIPVGAVSFDQVWQMPADTFFQYIPQVAGLYQYVCTPHIPNGMIGEFTVTNGSNTQTYVPDANFEAYLEANGMGNGIPNDEYVTTANIDTLTNLDVGGQNISDLTGIEDFTALTLLFCNGNQLSSLDVSNNNALITLHCSSNQLTNLDISGATSLTTLFAGENNLTNINISNNPNLIFLDCGWNQLISLDISNNTLLYYLYCGQNQLTTLDLSNNTVLGDFSCDHNSIGTLDISQNAVLEIFVCSYNQLTSLDLRNGNNANLIIPSLGEGLSNNPDLYCISVDDTTFSNTYWTFANGVIDSQHYFSNNCSGTAIQEYSTNKELFKITDLLGRETKETNQPLFYIYDDGTIEKKIIIE